MPLALLAIMSTHTGAADETIVLPPVVITASRLPVVASATGASTTRLDRDDIERIAPSSTAELLRGLPGLHVGHAAGAAYVHLRGGDPNHTVVLVDGIQVNDPTDARGGAFDLDSIDPSEIERIEILRGAGSSVHGSDALAGVIHIHTRERPGRTWVSGEGGGLGYTAFAAGAGANAGRAALGVGVHHRGGGEAVDGHEYRTRGGHLQATIVGTATGLLRLTARVADDERTSHPEGSGGAAFAILDELEAREGRQLQLGARAVRPLGADTDLDAWIALARQHTEVTSPGAVDPGNPFASVPASRTDTRFRRTTAGVAVRTSAVGLQLSALTEIEDERGDSEGSIDLGQGQPTPTAFDRARQTRSLAIEALRPGDALTLHAAVRLDDAEGLGAEWSPRLGARYRWSSTGTELALSWGQAFKQPSLYAIGHPLVGNPELVPETSWTVDGGVTQSVAGGRIVVGLTGFHTRYRELIDFDFETFRLVNRSEVRVDGGEVTAMASLPAGLSLNGTASLATTEIEATGERLLERPEWILDTALDWQSGRGHRARVRVTVVDAIPSASVATGPSRLEGYARVDGSLSLPLDGRVRLQVAIDNVLDADYDLAVGAPAAGITPRVGLRGEL